MATEPEMACELIRAFDVAEINAMKKESQAAARRVDEAASALFEEMVGRKPTQEEFKEMLV